MILHNANEKEAMNELMKKIMKDMEKMAPEEAVSYAIDFLKKAREMMMPKKNIQDSTLANINSTLDGAMLNNVKQQLAECLYSVNSNRAAPGSLANRIKRYMSEASYSDKLAHEIQEGAKWRKCSIEDWLGSSEGRGCYHAIVHACGGHDRNDGNDFKHNSVRDYVGLLSEGMDGDRSSSSSSYDDGEMSVDLRVPFGAKSDLEKLAEALRDKLKENSGAKFNTNVPFGAKRDDNSLESILKKLASK